MTGFGGQTRADGKKKNPKKTAREKKISAIVMSGLAIFMVTVAISLTTGGAISLAIAFEGEDKYQVLPDDINGIQVLNSSCSGGTNCNTVTQTCTGWATTQSTLIISKWSDNYTKVNHAGAGACGAMLTSNWINIQFSSALFPNPNNHTFSTFTLEMFKEASYSTNGDRALRDAFNVSMSLNGTGVFNFGGVSTKVWREDGATNERAYMNMILRMGVFEEFRYRQAASECYPNCSVVLNISGYPHTTTIFAPFSDDFGIRIESYTTDVDTTNAIFKFAPWVLAVMNFIIALASTTYWNPVMSAMKKKGASIS